MMLIDKFAMALIDEPCAMEVAHVSGNCGSPKPKMQLQNVKVEKCFGAS